MVTEAIGTPVDGRRCDHEHLAQLPAPIVALANSWVIINVGGGPTDGKPTVRWRGPRHRPGEQLPLNVWSARGAELPGVAPGPRE
jgi:hypothetical protein